MGLSGVSNLYASGTGVREPKWSDLRAKGPGPGSLRMLSWIGRLGAAGVEPMRLALGLGRSSALSHVARLATAGLLERIVVGDGQGTVVVLTAAGAREVRAREPRVVSSRTAALSSARHSRGVSWIAAWAQVQEWAWLGPADLRAQKEWRITREDGARHLPDLGVFIGDGRNAVELELHAKAPQRLSAILRGYRRRLDAGELQAVSYIVDRVDVEALVSREARKARLGDALRIGRLDDIVGHVREGAAR